MVIEGAWDNRKDGLGIMLLKEAGIPTIVVSMEKNPVVKKRCQKLKIECFQGISDRKGFIYLLLKKKGLKWQEIAYIGDSVIDKEAIKKAGLGMTVLDAEPEIHSIADYIIPIKGGEGALREVAKVIINKNGTTRSSWLVKEKL